jgi:hypothetical protein
MDNKDIIEIFIRVKIYIYPITVDLIYAWTLIIPLHKSV